MNEIKIAMIGLDTVHAVQYAGYLQDTANSAERRVHGMKVVSCMSFTTGFMDAAGIAKREAYMKSIGVRITDKLDDAVKDCDAIMLELNDPAQHLEFFEKCAPYGKPIWIDKPFADTWENAQKIIAIAKKFNVKFATASCRRFDEVYLRYLPKMEFTPREVVVWSSLGTGPKGTELLVWYGVHPFEILERVMGSGAKTVHTSEDTRGYVCHVTYGDGRRAVVEMIYAGEGYGILARNGVRAQYIPCKDNPSPACELLEELRDFFSGDPLADPVPLADSLEVFALSIAAQKSLASGKTEPLPTL